MSLKSKSKLIETVSFSVQTTKHDIENGKCGLISKCMHKVAIERALRKLDPKGGDHKVKIDGGNISFNFNDHRYRGLTPKIVKRSVIQFDRERPRRTKAEKTGLKFESKVEPVQYKIEGQRGAKIHHFSRERQEQINAARRKRKAEGRPDRRKYDLRYRVEGLAGV